MAETPYKFWKKEGEKKKHNREAFIDIYIITGAKYAKRLKVIVL